MRRPQLIVEETAEDAGITKQVHPHLLRHTMAARLINQGMPPEHIRKVLGQESIDLFGRVDRSRKVRVWIQYVEGPPNVVRVGVSNYPFKHLLDAHLDESGRAR